MTTIHDPVAAVEEAYRRLAGGQEAAWISVVPEAVALARARELLDEGRRDRPLWGVPFAVKDNIDVAGMVTTAGCPAYASTAERTAPAAQRLLDAGAVLIGKTNLDQFATGLVGTRSPYGTCHSVLDPALISGGSSSGSAVVVAEGVVPFALGTDTAGSGRVPAAANGIDADYLTIDPLPGDAYDTSAGLTRPGVLRLPMPDESLIFAPPNDVGDNPRAGVGDNPPRIDDAEPHGILGAALYQPVWTSAIVGPYEFALAVTCFVLLMVWKAPPWSVVIVAAFGGLLIDFA